MSKVYVGCGHMGPKGDPGAVAGGYMESELAFDIGKRVNALLKAAGVTTRISRNDGAEGLDLSPKITACNAFQPDLAVDIHINAGGGVGWEAYCTVNGGTGRTLALNIEQEIKKITTSRGVKTRVGASGSDYFGWIRQVECPSIILEACFIDTPADVAKVATAEGRQKFAQAYTTGILRTLGAETKAATTAVASNNYEQKPSVIVYRTVADVPAFGKATVKKLVAKGMLLGNDDGKIDLPHETLRIFVMLDRAGLLDAMTTK